MTMKTTLSIVILLASSVATSTAWARPGDTSCPSGQEIQTTFSSGGKWELCWQESQAEGIVLSNIYFTPPSNARRKILGEASVSQIHTEFDDGYTTQAISVTSGLGGANLLPLSNVDCAQGQLLAAGGRNVVCHTTHPRGYIYKTTSGLQRQGQLMELFSVSDIDGRTYVVRWHFYDNGIIAPATGLSGTLPRFGDNAAHGWPVTALNRIAIGFTDHVFWRLDFDLGGTDGDDIVEEITAAVDASGNKRFKAINRRSFETGRSLDYATKRFWRVRDNSLTNGQNGHISYELVVLNYAHQSPNIGGDAWAASDVFFTRYDPCERQALGNTSTGCSESIDEFVNGQAIDVDDVVVWYRQAYHHLPRDEDDNRVAVRWNGFELLPRDWIAANPL